jgi:hypothetical protein
MFSGRAQRTPKGMTIVLAVVLVLVGIAGTFLHLIPGAAGISGETFGVIAYVVATVLMLIGIFTRGL